MVQLTAVSNATYSSILLLLFFLKFAIAVVVECCGGSLDDVEMDDEHAGLAKNLRVNSARY